jgi:hypothetical protein
VTTTNLVSTLANVTTLNVTSAQGTFLGPILGSNTGAFSNIFSANAVTTTNAFVTTANVTNLVVPGSLTANSTNTTFFYDTLVIPYINVTTLNVISISNLVSLTTNLISPLANITTLNVSSLENVTNLYASLANITTLNVTSAQGTFLGPVVGANTGAFSNLYSANALVTTNAFATTANVTTLNVASAQGTFLGPIVGSNTGAFSNLYSANAITTTNAFVTTANITTLNVSSAQGTFLGPVVGASTGAFSTVTTTNAFVTLANITTLNVSSAQGTFYGPVVGSNTGAFSNLYSANALVTTNVVASLANITTLNVTSAQGTFLGSVIGANTGAFSNLYSANALVTTNVVATLANITTLNVSSASGTFYGPVVGSNTGAFSNLYSANALVTTNVVATLANVTTLNVTSAQGTFYGPVVGSNTGAFSNLYSANALVTTNVVAALANVTTLNVSSASGTFYGPVVGSNTGAFSNLFSANALTTTNAFVTTANVTTLNVSSLFAGVANVTTLNVSTLENVSNLSVSGNIVPVTQGNTYAQGNLVVSGNVFSSLGQLGVGGSLMFTLGSTYTPGTFTGVVPVAGTSTYKLQMTAFTKQGTSTYINVSSNGCFQFTQTGVYIVSALFMTDNNNVLGIGIGSNVIDYGTRTDQKYLYSLVPFVSQNPTEVLETQFYVSSTSLFYYLDVFSVDGIILQPTSNVLGGTFVSIAPLGGIAAASTVVTLATPGAVVTGQASSYGAQITDYYIGMTNGGTVTLPIGGSLTAGKTYVIKDESGQAGLFVSKRVTVAAYSPNLIDGQTSAVIALNYGSLSLVWTGSTWSIFRGQGLCVLARGLIRPAEPAVTFYELNRNGLPLQQSGGTRTNAPIGRLWSSSCQSTRNPV